MNGSESYERQVTFELANVGSGRDTADAATLAETNTSVPTIGTILDRIDDHR